MSSGDPHVEQAPSPLNFANLDPSAQTEWLLAQAEASARQIADIASKADALIAVAEQSPPDAPIWEEVHEFADLGKGYSVPQRLRALTTLSRHAESEDVAERHWLTALKLGTQEEILRANGDSPPPTIRIFNDLLKGQTDEKHFDLLERHASQIEIPATRSAVELLIATRLVEVGYREAHRIRPGTLDDLHDLVAIRAAKYAQSGDIGPAYGTARSINSPDGRNIDLSGTTRVHLAIALQKGPEDSIWEAILQNLQKLTEGEDERFSNRDKLAFVVGLLAAEKDWAAHNIAATLPIQEYLGTDYMVDAALAIAAYENERQDGPAHATRILDEAQEDVTAVQHLALRRRRALQGDGAAFNNLLLQQSNRTLDRIAIVRMQLEASHNPAGAWELLEQTQFASTATEGEPSPLAQAQAAIIHTMIQRHPALLAEAVEKINTIDDPVVQSELYLEAAAHTRKFRNAGHIARTAIGEAS